MRSGISSSWREVNNASKQFTGWVDWYMWGGIWGTVSRAGLAVETYPGRWGRKAHSHGQSVAGKRAKLSCLMSIGSSAHCKNAVG